MRPRKGKMFKFHVLLLTCTWKRKNVPEKRKEVMRRGKKGEETLNRRRNEKRKE